MKREQRTYETLGQVQHYMGWVMRNFVEKNGQVEGLIICHSVDAKLRCVLEPASDVSLLTNEVDFHLHNPEKF